MDDAALLGPDHPNVATVLSNFAGLLINTGNHAEARELLERALAIHERALGPDHPELAQGQEFAAHFALARALVATDDDRSRALAECDFLRHLPTTNSSLRHGLTAPRHFLPRRALAT